MNDCETCQQGGEGRGCACALWATRRVLRIPDSIKQGERMELPIEMYDEPVTSPDQARDWSLAALAVVGVLALFCFGAFAYYMRGVVA